MVRAAREAADARRDAEWRDVADGNKRRVVLTLAAPIAPAVVVAIIGLFVHVLLIVGGVLLLAAMALSLGSWSASRRSFATALGGSSPEEAAARGVISQPVAARFVDLTEQLCTTLGLPVPELRVIAEESPNSVSLGLTPESTVIALTSGLLSRLERIELEGVIAHELAHVKRGDGRPVAFEMSPLGRLVIGIGGERLALWLEGHSRESAADLAGVGVTRYPPGLRAALEKTAAAGPPRAPGGVGTGVVAATGRAWLAPLVEGEPGSAVTDRVDVLSEL
jgi:hypothetical protein